MTIAQKIRCITVIEQRDSELCKENGQTDTAICSLHGTSALTTSGIVKKKKKKKKKRGGPQWF